MRIGRSYATTRRPHDPNLAGVVDAVHPLLWLVNVAGVVGR